MALDSALSNPNGYGPMGGIRQVQPDTTFATDMDSSNAAAMDAWKNDMMFKTKFRLENPDLAMDYATSPGLMVADKLGLGEPYRTIMGLASPDLLKLFAAGGITLGKLVERLGYRQTELEEAMARRGGGLKAAMAAQKPENKVPIEAGRKGLAAAIDDSKIELIPYEPKNAPKAPAKPVEPEAEPDLIPFDRGKIEEEKKARKLEEDRIKKKQEEEAAAKKKKEEEEKKKNPFRRPGNPGTPKQE